MKKLMTMAVIAVAAIASQAADIKWGARNIYIPVATDATKSQTGIQALSGDKFAAGALTVALFWVDNDGGRAKIGDYATTGAGTISAQVLGNSSTATSLYDAMLAQGSTYKPSYYFTASYATANGTYTYSGTAVANNAISTLPSSAIGVTADFKTAGTWDYTANEPEPTPEPTSGLLMLLGMAGLALRRKRA